LILINLGACNISKRILGPVPLVLQNIYPGRHLSCCKRSTLPSYKINQREKSFRLSSPPFKKCPIKIFQDILFSLIVKFPRTPHAHFLPFPRSLSFPFQQPRHDAMQAPSIFSLTPLSLYRCNGNTVPSHRPTTLAQSSVTKPLPWIPERETCIVAQLCRRARGMQ
jgi:hypothetical protein